jgi:membrane fusion protein (multidrug efflux system)
MKKFLRILLKLGVTLSILLVAVGAVVGIYIKQIQMLIAAGGNMQMPAESVSVAPAESQQWYDEIRAVGTVVADNGIEITPETSEVVEEILFESGAMVEADTLLIKLNSTKQRAQLKAAQAAADLASIEVKRARELFEKEAIAKSELDNAEARVREAEAQVENLQALLSYTEIRAPFAGRLGVRKVNKGEYVSMGQPLVSLHSINPVHVDAYIPQTKLGQLKEGYEVVVRSEGIDGGELFGKLTALNSEVDPATRNILVRATFENADGALRPGMFVNLFVRQPEPREVIAVPSTAVIYAPYGDSIYIVKEGEGGSKTAEQKIVRLGEARGDFVEITRGLEAGVEVVVSGAFKLRNGAPIEPQEGMGLEYSQDPKPQDA